MGEKKGNLYPESSVSPRSAVHSLETGCSCLSTCGPCLLRGGRGRDMTPGCLAGPVSPQSPSKGDGEAGGRHPKCCGCCPMFRSFRIKPGSEAAFGVTMASTEGGWGSEGRPLPSLPRRLRRSVAPRVPGEDTLCVCLCLWPRRAPSARMQGLQGLPGRSDF